MAPSPGLLLRTTRPAWHLFVPILVLRLQPSSLWWSQPLPRTAACPLFIFHPPPAFPQPEAKARGHTDIEHPVARNAASCCVGAGAALASFACPLAPSNSLFSSAAASGLGRVAPTRAAHWGGPESLAHLWRGKGHHLASHNLHACSVGFPTCPQLGPGAGPRSHLAGSLQRDVPIARLHSHSRTRCLVCCLNVSQAHGVHPRCHPNGHRRLATPIYPFQPSKLPRLPPCGMSL